MAALGCSSSASSACGGARRRRPALTQRGRALRRASLRSAAASSLEASSAPSEGQSREERNANAAKLLSLMVAGDVITNEDGDRVCPPEGCLDELLVEDIMTEEPAFVSTDSPVFAALGLLVEKGLSGMPVVRAGSKKVVGVISGYDVLALDYTPGQLDRSAGLFPPLGSCDGFDGKRDLMWKAHFDLQDRLDKSTGTTVGDIMHEAAIVRPDMRIADAANLIVHKQIHRVPVVNAADELVGVLSRGDVLKVTWTNYLFYEELYNNQTAAVDVSK